MAQSLREALKAKDVETTHSECLEFDRQAFAYDNGISCRQGRGGAPPEPTRSLPRRSSRSRHTLYCSFCGKSQYACGAYCRTRRSSSATSASRCANDIIENERSCGCLRRMTRAAMSPRPPALSDLRGKSTEQLVADVERANKHSRAGAPRCCRSSESCIATARCRPEADALASPGFAYLRKDAREPARAQQQHERALRDMRRCSASPRPCWTSAGRKGQIMIRFQFDRIMIYDPPWN